jgi:hypothetical protein
LGKIQTCHLKFQPFNINTPLVKNPKLPKSCEKEGRIRKGIKTRYVELIQAIHIYWHEEVLEEVN